MPFIQDIKNNKHSGWKTTLTAVKWLLRQREIFSYGSSYLYCRRDENCFFILPLVDLELLDEYRKNSNDYRSPTIFLCQGSTEIPQRLNKKFLYRSIIFGNPIFGSTAQAIFRGEAIFHENGQGNGINDQNQPVNFVDVMADGFLRKFDDVLSTMFKETALQNIMSAMGSYRQSYYEAFVNYYASLDAAKKVVIGEADIILQELHLENKQEDNLSRHLTPKEFARAPVSFYLQNLAISSIYLTGKVADGDKIRLLLIDNQVPLCPETGHHKEKFIKKEQDGTVGLGRLSELVLGGITGGCFEITMLGDVSLSRKKKTMEVNIDPPREEDKLEALAFNAEAFFTCHSGAMSKYGKSVLDHINRSHFVLLDFFLNEENSFLAFDLIEEISRIRENHSTTWYFITSAVYDSVTRYAQSGLLAEYYESAVVNAGDDPTNSKRQIIFLYKLLTFINARIRSIHRHSEYIFNRLLTTKDEDGYCRICCAQAKKGDFKRKNDCLSAAQQVIKRFITEDERFASLIFPQYDSRKEVLERIDDTINKFRYLPEADWQMVQRQIDFINHRLQDAGDDNAAFACSFITEEIFRRSEIY